MEKCRKLGGGYDAAVVKIFEMNLRSSKILREILNTLMDTKRKEEIDFKKNIEIPTKEQNTP